MYKNLRVNEHHEFVIDLPSATRLVNEIYPFDADDIPEKYLIMGQEKGNCVHKRIEMYLKWNKDIGCSHNVETHNTHFENFKKWWSKFRLELSEEIKIFTELPLTNMETKGIIDCVIYDKGTDNIYIIDWKTTKDKHKDKENLQTFIYQELVIENCSEIFQSNHRHKPEQYKRLVLNTNTQKSYELKDNEKAYKELSIALDKWKSHKNILWD